MTTDTEAESANYMEYYSRWAVRCIYPECTWTTEDYANNAVYDFLNHFRQTHEGQS